MRQEIDEDVFDQMAQALHQSNNPHNPPPITSTRWQPDGTYDKNPLDPKYFQKYYQKKLTTPFTCPDCGRTISRKSNLSKHRQTNRYMDSRPHNIVKMADCKMLEKLSEECLLNISSFLLGTPEQLRLHNNKALRRIQHKNKFIIEEIDEEVARCSCNYIEEKYGYILENQ
jgi:hypothetical protein